MKIHFPSKRYLNKAYELLMKGEVNLDQRKYDYYHLNEKIYDSEDFQKLLLSNGITPTKISSGTSDRKAFDGLIQQSIRDLKASKYYRNYSSSRGNRSARKAISYMENAKFPKDVYSQYDICFATGSTGAITTVFEYIKKRYSNAEVLIATPVYYVYKFAAQYWNLPYKEIFSFKNNSFKPVDSLIQNITGQTKLIVLTQPSNPTGELYSEQEMRKLFSVAVKKNILILIDELFMELLFLENPLPSDVIANKINALQNVVIVKGFSKNKNLAAFRIGYLLSKSKDLIEFAEKSSEVRQCFPVASNFTGVIILNSFLETVSYLLQRKQAPQLSVIKNVQKDFSFADSIKKLSPQDLLTQYNKYQNYKKKLLDFYSQNFDLTMKILKDDIEYQLPKISAFNTFVKIKDIDNINFFDFCFNFYLTCGVETQIGPCYAFDQRTWEKNPELGFWLRITFARDRKQFLNGLRKFKEFKKIYIERPEKFLKTSFYF